MARWGVAKHRRTSTNRLPCDSLRPSGKSMYWHPALLTRLPAPRMRRLPAPRAAAGDSTLEYKSGFASSSGHDNGFSTQGRACISASRGAQHPCPASLLAQHPPAVVTGSLPCACPCPCPASLLAQHPPAVVTGSLPYACACPDWARPCNDPQAQGSQNEPPHPLKSQPLRAHPTIQRTHSSAHTCKGAQKGCLSSDRRRNTIWSTPGFCQQFSSRSQFAVRTCACR